MASRARKNRCPKVISKVCIVTPKEKREETLDTPVSKFYRVKTMQDLKAITTKAIEQAGGGAMLARELGVTRQAVYQWKLVPPQHVLDVERITGVSRHQLRPDLFGTPELAR